MDNPAEMLHTKSVLCYHNQTADFYNQNKFFYFQNNQNTFIINHISIICTVQSEIVIKVIFQGLCFLSSSSLVLPWGGLEV